MLLNNEWVNNEIKEEIKKFLETMKSQQSKTYGTEQRQSWGEVPIDTGPHKQDGNISNKQSNPTSTRTGGSTTNKAQRV